MKSIKNKNLIVLIRHGESDYNQVGIVQGQSDNAELTEVGISQATIIGDWLNDIDCTSMFSSPMRRCIQTAESVATQMGFQSNAITIDPRLVEIDFGPWTGRLRREITEEYKDQYRQWRDRPFDLQLNNGYPVRDLYARVGTFVEELVNPASKPSTKVIVAHRGTIAALVVSLLGLPKSHHHFLQIDRGSVTILQEISRSVSKIDYELVGANERPHAATIHPVDFETEERTGSKGEIYLVRHGQTDANIDRRYQGGRNNSLSKIGRDSMNLLAESLVPCPPTRIISSPLCRAIESASILGNKLGNIAISKRTDLHEYLYGVWEGMAEKDVRRYRTEEYSQWKSASNITGIPNAEHINDAYNRCRIIWEYYEHDVRCWGGSIISVAHDIVNRLIICNALDLPANYLWRFRQTNASVTVIAVKQTYDGKLRMLNHGPYPLSTRLSDAWL